MGRKKVNNKKKKGIKSVSLPPRHIKFLNETKDFDLSKFVQVKLEEHINYIYSIKNV